MAYRLMAHTGMVYIGMALPSEPGSLIVGLHKPQRCARTLCGFDAGDRGELVHEATECGAADWVRITHEGGLARRMDVHVVRNKTRVHEIKRSPTFEQKLNVHMILVDAASLTNFIHNAPRTVHFAESLVSSGDLDEWIPFAFMRYHAIGINTRANMYAFLAGASDWGGGLDTLGSLEYDASSAVGVDSSQGVLSVFHDAGYLTTSLIEMSLQYQMPYWRNCANSDHSFSIGSEADWNRVMAEEIHERVCFGDHTKFDSMVQFLSQVAAAYPGLPRFSYVHVHTADHQPDGAGLRVFDTFLQPLLADRSVFNRSNSLVIVLSDHGWYPRLVVSPSTHAEYRRLVNGLFGG